VLLHIDADGDGVGTAAATRVCPQETPGYVNVSGDCNDGDICMYPGNNELCRDGKDNDCGISLDDPARCVDPLSLDFGFSNTKHGIVNGTYEFGSWVDTRSKPLLGFPFIPIVQNFYVVEYEQQTLEIFYVYDFNYGYLGSIVVQQSSTPLPIINEPTRMSSDMLALSSGNFAFVYAFMQANATSSSGMDINFAINTSPLSYLGTTFSIQTIATDAIVNTFAPGWVVYGGPTMCINKQGNMVVAFEIWNGASYPDPEYYDVLFAINTTNTFPYTWTISGPFLVSLSLPLSVVTLNPVIRNTGSDVGFGYVYAPSYNTSTFNYNLTYVYALSINGSGASRSYEIFTVAGPIYLLPYIERYYIDMIGLYDTRPVISITVPPGSAFGLLSAMSVCFPVALSDLSNPWTCQFVDMSGYSISTNLRATLTLLNDRLFVGYWTQSQELLTQAGVNILEMPLAFNQIVTTPKYATNCMPIPSGLAWEKFTVPQLDLLGFPGNTAYYGLIIYVNTVSIMVNPLTNNTIAMAITDYLAFDTIV